MSGTKPTNQKESRYLPQSQFSLFAADTRDHASPSALPGSEQARKMTAISGLKFSGLSKKSGPLGSCVKTLLGTSVWASTVCSLTWKARGINSKYSLFQLVPSVPTTAEIGSGFLPTPTSSPMGSNTSMRRHNTTTKERYQLWHTPRANDAEKRGNLAPDDRSGLPAQVQHPKMWPTPTANEDAAGRPGRKMQAMLGNHPEIRGTTVAEWEGGSLNPQWVEWLMGFQEGWTDLSNSETQ